MCTSCKQEICVNVITVRLTSNVRKILRKSSLYALSVFSFQFCPCKHVLNHDIYQIYHLWYSHQMKACTKWQLLKDGEKEKFALRFLNCICDFAVSVNRPFSQRHCFLEHYQLLIRIYHCWHQQLLFWACLFIFNVVKHQIRLHWCDNANVFADIKWHSQKGKTKTEQKEKMAVKWTNLICRESDAGNMFCLLAHAFAVIRAELSHSFVCFSENWRW